MTFLKAETFTYSQWDRKTCLSTPIFRRITSSIISLLKATMPSGCHDKMRPRNLECITQVTHSRPAYGITVSIILVNGAAHR